jgi:nitrite reductase/ring-hydroxylating ferredoxin subunit
MPGEVMKRFVRVAAEHEIPPGEGRHVEVGEHVIAVFNHAGRFYALEGTCPHQGGPLGEGYLDAEGVVTCPWHAWQFRVDDGRSPLSPALRVRTYDVEVRGGEVLVAVEE